MHCVNCGATLNPNSKFCGHCGHHLVKREIKHISPLKKWLVGLIVVICGIGLISWMYVLPYLAKKGIAFLPIYKGNISGTVYKTDGKTPFEGVEVQLEGTSETSRSDSSGMFYFFEVPVRKYILRGVMDGHQSTKAPLTVTYKSTVNTSITLPVTPVEKGHKILTEKVDSSKSTSEIWIMDRDGKNKRRLLEGSNPEILESGTEMIVTRNGKRYQSFIDGSGELLVGTQAPVINPVTNRESILPQKSALSPDKTKTGLIEDGDIWLLSGNDKVRITSLNDKSIEGLFWISNDELLYLESKDSKFIISLLNIQTKETKEIFNDKSTIYWSHDHKYFAIEKYTSGSCFFCSEEEESKLQDKQKDNGLWIYKIADGSNRRITDSTNNIYQNLSWIPNSSLLTYTVNDSENKDNNGLYLVDASNESSQGKLVLKDTNDIDFTDASWSISKDALVTKTGYLVKLDGSVVKRITDKSAQFNWLPSGKVIYVLSSDNSTWVTTNGDDQKKLTDTKLSLTYSLSSDGGTILTEGGGISG
jgi:hypothetical protein